MEVPLSSPRRLPSASMAAAALLAVTLVGIDACAKPKMRSTLNRRPTAAEMAELWVRPGNIATRDLFWGAADPKLAPKPGTKFDVVAFDESGMSGGWDVKDPATGIEYSVAPSSAIARWISASRTASR